jgi:hypothetical protein
VTTEAPLTTTPEFRVELDAPADDWIRRQPGHRPIVVAFSVTRCCGGTKVCDVRVRLGIPARGAGTYTQIGTVAGRDLLVDSRIARALPRRIPITVRGLARKRLSLDFSGEEWGRLLYA